tara:strand:- start:228 stop:479 length:252 start_codon:yes stop_codon:yes gene_type:complete
VVSVVKVDLMVETVVLVVEVDMVLEIQAVLQLLDKEMLVVQVHQIYQVLLEPILVEVEAVLDKQVKQVLNPTVVMVVMVQLIQ